MEWVDGNIGSKVTMKYPAVWMIGEHAKGEMLSIAFAGEGQHQDAGAKMVHAAPQHVLDDHLQVGGPRRRPHLLPRSGADRRGRARTRSSTVKCDALLVDTISRSDTYPYVDVREDDVSMGHEATVSKVSEDQLFYLMSRGLTEDEAMAMIVRGFVEPIARELPDGVRAGAQPADRAADGRGGRLTQPADPAPGHVGRRDRARAGTPSRPSGSTRPGRRADAGRASAAAGPDRGSRRHSHRRRRASRRAAAPPATRRLRRCRPAARRSGGSPRWPGCAACSTAVRRRRQALTVETERRPTGSSVRDGRPRRPRRSARRCAPADRVSALA